MRTRSDLEWLAFTIAAAIAAHFVAVGDTPIDRSLPVVVVLLAVSGWAADAQLVQIAVPLLLVAAMVLPAEHARLFAYGTIGAAAFSWAVFKSPAVLHIVTGVMLIRWIPPGNVVLWREIVVLAGALCVGQAIRGREAVLSVTRESSACLHSIIAALAIALVTPTEPARLMVFPFVIAFLMLLPVSPIIWGVLAAAGAAYARYSIASLLAAAAFAFLAAFLGDNHARHSLMRVPLYVCAVALLAIWPWSGVAARAMPRLLLAEHASPNERPVWVALTAGQSVSMDAPLDAHYAILTASGANASRLRAGRVVGRAEVVGRDGEVIRRELQIGDLADFGFTRREHFFTSRNPLPRRPLDDIHGYGIAAWLHTAGRVGMASADPIAFLRVTAAADLPADVKLQVEAVDFE